MKTLDDVKLIQLKTFLEPDGSLVPIESDKDVPFLIERVFYVYGVEDQNNRGKHAHYDTEQILICLIGRIEVTCKDECSSATWILDSPNKALYVPNMIWDEQKYCTSNSVLLVLASTRYDIEDYIEIWDEFIEEKKREK
jgi:hypothetical protein